MTDGCLRTATVLMLMLLPCEGQTANTTPTSAGPVARNYSQEAGEQGNAYAARAVGSLPPYVPEHTVTGVIRISGHASAKNPWMRQLVTAWQTDLQRFQPGLSLEYRMFGTSSAIPALFNGTADIAILGEEIDPVAVRTFERVMHHAPVGIDIATGSVDIRNMDFAQMFFVNKANPLTKLSLVELDAIFGEEHRRGPSNIRTWGQLGLGRTWADKPIHPYGWEIDDDFGYFLEQYLMQGSHHWNCDLRGFAHIYRPDGSVYDSGQQILDALAKDPYGIAVSNVRYAGADVRPLALGMTPAGPFYAVDKQSLIDGTYPLTRRIPAVIDRTPGMPIDPRLKEFVRYLLSRDGQRVLLQDGRYLPLSAEAARRERKKLE